MRTKPRFIAWTVSLAAVLWVSACAPAATPQPPTLIPTLPATNTPVPTLALDTATPDPSTLFTPTVQFVPTSRGPNLEATDPTTVSLASGGLQLVEFFRFT